MFSHSVICAEESSFINHIQCSLLSWSCQWNSLVLISPFCANVSFILLSLHHLVFENVRYACLLGIDKRKSHAKKKKEKNEKRKRTFGKQRLLRMIFSYLSLLTQNVCLIGNQWQVPGSVYTQLARCTT